MIRAAIITALMASPAMAQTENCAKRDLVMNLLTERFGETRQAIGLASGNQIVEMLANAETQTWTLTVTTPSGLTCIIGAGQLFQRVDKELDHQGEQM